MRSKLYYFNPRKIIWMNVWSQNYIRCCSARYSYDINLKGEIKNHHTTKNSFFDVSSSRTQQHENLHTLEHNATILLQFRSMLYGHFKTPMSNMTCQEFGCGIHVRSTYCYNLYPPYMSNKGKKKNNLRFIVSSLGLMLEILSHTLPFAPRIFFFW